jgi:hypothetical protein
MTTSTTTTEIPEFVQTVREQLLSAVKQGQQVSIDAAQAWVKALSALPTPDLPTIPGVPNFPGAKAVSKFSFDVASDLLNSQRDFALKLVDVLVPDKTA